MKFNFNKIWQSILKPPTWVKVVTFIVTVLSATSSLLIVFLGGDSTTFDVIAYLLFGIAGLSLCYSVYLIIPIFPKLKDKIVAFMERFTFTHLILRSFGFRTVIFAIGSFLMSMLFSGFNAYMGIVNRSIWYGSLSAFYISLMFLRGGVLIYHKNRLGKEVDLNREELSKAKVYKNSGIITLILNVALSVAIAQMIFADAHFSYLGWTVFAFAAYAFFKITVAIITLFKAHRQDDLTVRAIRNINLIDALVSILALQTALMSAFGDGTLNTSLMNTLTGSVVSLLSIGIGVYMIVSANKQIKKLTKDSI
ncbi:MAG: hypothetical protein J6B16_04670 [Clostridia bacterium]|nr:hypothetical protein [Clostridia bacterium]